MIEGKYSKYPDHVACAKVQYIISELQSLQMQASRVGLYVTARALNNAMNAAGWELAGNVEAADKASRGERVGEPK